ncbi:MAG: hypothetical protein QXO74_06160 [Candidatus Methanomethylicia archaeon]
MKLSVHHRDKGFATVIGAIFFVLMSMLIVTFIYDGYRKQMEMYNFEKEVLRERIDLTVTISKTLGFTMSIDNNGHETAEIIRFWIIDLTGNLHYNYTLPEGKRVIPSHSSITIESYEIMGSSTLIKGRYYIFRLITARGNIIETNSIKALPGNIASTYPQALQTLPQLPWLSNETVIVSTNASETPVYNISSEKNRVVPYDGREAYISIKNTGDAAIFLTSNTRIIFRSLNENKSYAGILSGWYIYRWDPDKKEWKSEDSGSISPYVDSKVIYPGMVVVLEFSIPSEVPGSTDAKYRIKKGTYDVYLLLEGYDAYGKKFTSTIYYGTVSF